MMRSIRARLAIWYTVAFGLCMGALGWVLYSYVARATATWIDDELKNVAAAFAQLRRSAVDTSSGAVVERMQRLARADNFEFVVFDEARREIASNSRVTRLRRSRRIAPLPAPAPDSLLLRPDLASLFAEAGTAGDAFAFLHGPLGLERAYAVVVPTAGRREIVAVIEGLEDQEQMLKALRRSLWWMVPIGLLAGVSSGAFLAGRALRPVAAIASQAERIEARTLSDRIPIANPNDELGHISAAFNRLLGRLEAAFAQQRRFMAEASHELRTPIAVVRGEADLALTRTERPPAEYREALGVIRDEGRRMTRIVEDLFLLARADAGEVAVVRLECDVADLIAGAVRSAQSLAATRSVSIEIRTEQRPVISVDRAMLHRLLTNLLENAIKYGREGGRIVVTLGGRPDEPTISVADDGPGIPAEFRDRIFDRFFRGPGVRATDGDGAASGAGLGLAIARSIAETHGGSVTLTRSDGEGTEFVVTLRG